MNIYSLQLSASQRKKLYESWKDSEVKTPQYAEYQLRPENCVITSYTSGKVVFQGKDAEVYASPYLEGQVNKEEKKQKTGSSFKDIFPQAGSDEVGTGDYFGPICVCASIITEETLPLLQECGVRDSKKITDEMILEIAPKLMQKIPYSLLILDNEKYNIVNPENNMNAIKAKLHNQAYINLSKKYDLPSFKIIDQFTPEKTYYRYLTSEKQVIRGIHFETKAEDKYPSVGAGSVIARYAFLKKMEEMEKAWDMDFQKGAGSKVDICASLFVKKYGREQLKKVAKMNFANTNKLK